MLRLQNDFAKWGVVATATNKTSTLKNICKGASKVRCSFSHRVFSLVLCYMNKEGEVECDENNFKKTTKK